METGMIKENYTREELASALYDIGLREGDIVFSHSNIGYFGCPDGEKTVENAYQTILNAFFDVIGKSGTLIVPSFTYSHSSGKVFNYEETPSTCGIFTEMLRKDPKSIRSSDPNVSVVAFGSQVKDLTQCLPINSYSETSFFGRFLKAKGKICNLNFDAGSTFIHFVERMLGVDYRYDKTFSGLTEFGTQSKEVSSVLYVQDYNISGSQANFEAFNRLAISKNMYTTQNVGRGMVGCISADATYNLIASVLPANPHFLIQLGFSSNCSEMI